jgi:hypothetical protein
VLTSFLRHPDPAVRCCGVLGLRFVAWREAPEVRSAVTALQEALADQDAAVHEAAVAALGDIEAPAMIKER